MRQYLLYFLVFLSISSFAFSQNPLDKVVKLLDSGQPKAALEEIQKIKETVKVALPARAFWYEFAGHRELLFTAPSLTDSIFHLRAMIETFETIQPLDVQGEFAPQMKETLVAQAKYWKNRDANALLDGQFVTFMKVNPVYLQLGKTLGMRIEELAYQSAEFAKEIDSLNSAIGYYKLCTELNYETQLAYANWISLLQVQRKREDADVVMKEASSLFDSAKMVSLAKALAAYEKNLPFTALKVVQDELVNDPNNPALNYLLGMVNLQTNRPDAAVEGFHKVEESMNDSYLTNYQLGYYYLNDGLDKRDNGSLTLAKFYLDQCIAQQENDLFLYLTIMKLYRYQNNITQQLYIRSLFQNQ